MRVIGGSTRFGTRTLVKKYLSEAEIPYLCLINQIDKPTDCNERANLLLDEIFPYNGKLHLRRDCV